MLKFSIEQGLRTRVAIALATFCICMVGSLGIGLYFISDDIEEDHIEQVINLEMNHQIKLYGKHADSVPQVGASLQSYVILEVDDEFQMPTYLRGLNPGRHKIHYDFQYIRVLVRNVNAVKFVVAYHTALHEQRLSELRWLILSAMILVVAVSFAVGYFISGLLVRQVSDLAERVKLLAPGNTSDAILTRPDMDEEVAQLARALDDYQARIHRILQREQEFTANISHELRTPITTILTSCELLVAESDLPNKIRVRIDRIEAATIRMGEQLQALLFLAREQALGIMEPVAIAECIYDAVEPLQEKIDQKKLTFIVNVAPDIILILNRQALHTVLINLLRNAVQYTESGFIKVDYDHQGLSIADSGIGIEPAYLPLLYERFFRGSAQGEGLGIGLPIVKRICNHYGWLIDVESEPDRGSTFYITFPSGISNSSMSEN